MILLEPREAAGTPGWNNADSYALVAYVPGPLKEFLDDLRRRLEPLALSPRAHVTVLPPRCLAPGASFEDASRQVASNLPIAGPFEIAIGDVEIFPETNVIYLGIEDGADELIRMHRHLNAGALSFSERFEFHPHLTLVQDLSADEVAACAEAASEIWRGYKGTRQFSVEQLTLVQYTPGLGWRDLVEYSLAPVPVR